MCNLINVVFLKIFSFFAIGGDAMEKYSGRLSWGLVLAAAFVAVNVVVSHVTGECPNVSVENWYCGDQAGYNNDFCRVIVGGETQNGVLVLFPECRGGRMMVHTINRLRFNSPGKHIIHNEFVPCYSKVDCGSPFLVTDGSNEISDWEFELPNGQVENYRCTGTTINETANSYTAGSCPG